MSSSPKDGPQDKQSSGSSSAPPSVRPSGILDPNLDDGLTLTGPGAPTPIPPSTRSFSAPDTDHPVRARLLEKARMAGRGQQESFGSPAARQTPAPARAEGQLQASTLPSSRTPAPVSAIDISDLASRPPPAVAPLGPESSPASSDPHHEVAPPPSTDDDLATAGSEASTQQEVQPTLAPPTFRAPSLPPPPQLPPQREEPPESEQSPVPLLTPAPGDVMNELDRIARRSSVPKAKGPSLSPNMSALLGGLLGLTVIVTLGLVLDKSEGISLTKPKEETVEKKAEPKKEEAPQPPPRKKEKGPWRVMDDAQKAGHKVIGGKIGKLAFLRAIQDAGLPKSEAYRAYTSLKGLLDLDHCKSSDEFLALISGREKKLMGFEYIVSKEEVYQAKPNEAGHLQGKRLDLKVSRNQIRRSFVHNGRSFEDSARQGGFDPGIADVVSSALRGHSALSDFKAGDRMRIIAQEVTVLGEFSRYAGVEAMEILKQGKPPRRIYYYSHPIEGGHFDTNGRAPYEGGWRKPIPDAPVTSKFNMKRMHPVLNKVMPHTGTDFGAPMGTPIGATSPGVVSFIGPAGPSGNLVKVKHDGGYESGYAHLSKFAEGLKIGDKVDRLQLVGYCGSTGRSTGPHLHFTMKKDGAFIDAESLNLDGMRVLAKSHRGAFAEVRAKYDPILDAIPLPEVAAPSPPAEETQSEAAQDDTPSAGMVPEQPRTEAAKPTASTPAPSAQAPRAPAPRGAPAKKVAPSALFLSDEELLRMQGLTDDGEVDE